MFKWTIVHEMLWLRTNRTVSMGTESCAMTPVATEITLDTKTLSSQVMRGEYMAVGASIFRAILPIMTVAKTLKTYSIGGSRS